VDPQDVIEQGLRRGGSVARLSLGMSTGVVGLMAALTPQQLAVISARHWGVLRLRWHDQPDFWARLLVAARDDDEEALSEIHLHAKLLLSGELLARSTWLGFRRKSGLARIRDPQTK
jgi:hypothetical protein